MSKAAARIYALFLAVVLGGIVGLQLSCSASACQFCEQSEALTADLTASYVNASTSVGTTLMVVPTRTGGALTSATLLTGTLPPGMVLNANGSITGTPTQAGVYPLVISLCVQSRCVSCPVVITVNSAAVDPLNATYTNAATLVGTALTVPVNSGVVNGPVTAAALVPGTGALPPGMTLAANGTISGTPTAAGIYPVTVDLANAAGAHVAAPVIITVSAASATPITAVYHDTVGTAGTALAVPAPVLTGGPAVASTLQGGLLPPGLTLKPDGSITGTPTQPGTYTATITLTNASGGQITIQVTIIVNTSGVVSAMNASYAELTTPVAQPIAPIVPVVTNGPATSAHLYSGSLPPGLTLNADGSITGTPTVPGLYTLQITLGNAAGSFVVASVKITVTQLPITLAYADGLFPQGAAIAPRSATLGQAVAGLPTGFALSAGALPPGLALDPATGTVTGTPTAPGVYPFTVTATNGTRSASASATYIVMPASPLTVVYAPAVTLPAGTALAVQSPTLANPTPGVPTTYAVTGGALPAGLSLDPATGLITGIPTVPGVYTFTITASNGTRTASASATYTVTPAAPLTVAYAPTLVVPAGSAISTQAPGLVNPTPGVPTTYAVTGGALPAGLTLDPATGLITGTPTVPGVTTFTVTATNGTRTATTTPTYTVTPLAALTVAYTSQVFPANALIAIQSPALANPTPGVPTTYAVTTGSLPAGLSFDPSTGIISGTPTTPGAVTFTITATNGTRSATTTPTYTVTPVAALTVALTSQVFPAGSAIATQTAVVANATPGVATTYAVTTGALPAGLSLEVNTGLITGNPTTPGVTTFTVTATNGTRSATTTPTYTVTPAAALTVALTSQVFTANVLITAQTPVLANATPGVTTTYAVTTGSLPAGLVINAATGAITGTPTTPGVSTFTVTATNGTRTATTTPTYTVVPAAPMTEAYANLTAKAGTAILAQSPVLTNLTPGVPTTYAVTTGALPSGLSLDANTGAVTGTPSTAGVYSGFTITASNGTRSATASPTYTFTPALALSLAYGNLSVPQNVAIATQNATLTNATPGVTTTYAVTAGALPAGVTLNAGTGAITGTPTAAGVFTFTVTATNGTTDGVTARTATGSAIYTVVGTPTASLAGTPLVALTGTAATVTPTFSIPGGGTAVINQSINGGAGVSSGTAYSTGVHAAAGTTTYTLTVTNSLGVVITATVDIKWVSNTTTLAITNTGTTTIYTASNDPDSPLYGFQVVVPDQSAYDQSHSALCSGDTSLTVTRETSLTVGTPLAAGVYDYSHSFNLVSSVGYPFRAPVTVIMPYDPALAAGHTLGANDVPVPFFWDATFGKWVAASLKSVDTTNHLVAFTTLLPGRYAILGMPGLAASAVATASPAFTNGTDTWLQWNQGTFTNPGGSSLGMSALAAWYDPMWKANAGNTTKPGVGLANAFASNSDINAQALISRLANGTLESWNQMWKQQFITASGSLPVLTNYGLTDTQTGLALITGLKATGQPQLLLMADARPASGNAVATAVYAYDGSTGLFSLLDPNYPGDATTALTIDWDATANSGAGSFTAYNRAAGYSPALAKYAFEGQTSIHRLQDYEIVFDGATRATPWQNPPFATLSMNIIGDSSQLANLALTQSVSSANNVVIAGHVANGTDAPGQNYVFMSTDGSARVAQHVDASNNFAFTIPSLPNPYGTTVMLETSQNPCDPTFSHSGFQAFKVASLAPWFQDACFETATENRAAGTIGAWTHQTVNASASLNGYPVDINGRFVGSFLPSGDISGYCNVGGSAPNWTITPVAGTYVTWSTGFFSNQGAYIVGGQLLNNPSPSVDPHAHTVAGSAASTYLPMVLSGAKADRLNDDWNSNNVAAGQGAAFYPLTTSGNYRSAERVIQTITVPNTISSPTISFWWAAVLQAGTTQHAPPQRPYVDVIIQDMGTGTATWTNTGDATNFGNIYYHHFYAGDPAFAGWRPSVATAADTEWVSIPWQKMNLNLTAYKGHKVRVVISVADCTGGAHAGYAYVDSLTCD